MSLPIYQRVAVTDSGDVIPGAEYTVINENTGVAAPIYSDRTGATLLSAPYFADSVGTIQFFIAQGTTFRVAASGGVGTYTDRYVYGVAEAVLVNPDGYVQIGADSGAAFNNDAMLRLQRTGGRFFQSFKVDADQIAAIFFGDVDDDIECGIQYTASSQSLSFLSGNNSEAMRIDSARTLLVGKTTVDNTTVGMRLSGGTGFTSMVRDGGEPLLLNRLTSDGDLAVFRKDGTTVGSIGFQSTGFEISGEAGHAGISFATVAWVPMNDGARVDDTISLGVSSYRFDDIYLTNAPTITSDRNEKQDILEITTAEYNVAKACKGLLRSFRWIDAVEKKGDDARIHFGIIAQDLQDAFTAEGLDAGKYGMFMSNTWWETETEVAAVEAVDEVTDEDGNVTTEAVEAKDAYTRTDTFDTLAEAPAGATERTRLGVRYSELLAFIIAAL